jgi:hypothetical protein
VRIIKPWLYGLYPPPISVNTALIEVAECLENTTGDINVKLSTSLTTIHESDIYTPVAPLDVNWPTTQWIVVGVAIYICSVIDNMRHGANVVSSAIKPATRSKPGLIPG